MLSRHAVIEDLANSLALRRREFQRTRFRRSAYLALAQALVIERQRSAWESVGRRHTRPALLRAA